LGTERTHYSQVKPWSDGFATPRGATFRNPAERNELMLTTIKEFSTYFVFAGRIPRAATTSSNGRAR
jgi:hypothetical protein